MWINGKSVDIYNENNIVKVLSLSIKQLPLCVNIFIFGTHFYYKIISKDAVQTRLTRELRLCDATTLIKFTPVARVLVVRIICGSRDPCAIVLPNI